MSYFWQKPVQRASHLKSSCVTFSQTRGLNTASFVRGDCIVIFYLQAVLLKAFVLVRYKYTVVNYIGTFLQEILLLHCCKCILAIKLIALNILKCCQCNKCTRTRARGECWCQTLEVVPVGSIHCLCQDSLACISRSQANQKDISEIEKL